MVVVWGLVLVVAVVGRGWGIVVVVVVLLLLLRLLLITVVLAMWRLLLLLLLVVVVVGRVWGAVGVDEVIGAAVVVVVAVGAVVLGAARARLHGVWLTEHTLVVAAAATASTASRERVHEARVWLLLLLLSL